MAWIESHQELANHPKTKRFKRALGISTPQAIGHLHMLWWWALDYAQDGSLAGIDAEDIAEAAEWDEDAQAFVQALISAMFVDAGEMTIHDWDDYGSKFLKRREQARVRQQRYRDEHGRYQQSSNAEVTRDKRNSNTVTGQEKTRQDRRGEERPPNPPKGEGDAPRVGAGDPPRPGNVSVLPAPPKSEPYAAWVGYCNAAGLDITAATESTKGKALAATKRLLEAGNTVDEIAGCTAYLLSQSWRTSIVSLKTVEQEIGPWKMAGKPAQERARAPNGRSAKSVEAAMSYAQHLREQGR
ncbi:MAG: hypothetical protein KC442_11930 [Thermomicrobiales bacterium]|nr:hypothetical protein [Thermomicrobiales bacterium]